MVILWNDEDLSNNKILLVFEIIFLKVTFNFISFYFQDIIIRLSHLLWIYQLDFYYMVNFCKQKILLSKSWFLGFKRLFPYDNLFRRVWVVLRSASFCFCHCFLRMFSKLLHKINFYFVNNLIRFLQYKDSWCVSLHRTLSSPKWSIDHIHKL